MWALEHTLVSERRWVIFMQPERMEITLPHEYLTARCERDVQWYFPPAQYWFEFHREAKNIARMFRWCNLHAWMESVLPVPNRMMWTWWCRRRAFPPADAGLLILNLTVFVTACCFHRSYILRSERICQLPPRTQISPFVNRKQISLRFSYCIAAQQCVCVVCKYAHMCKYIQCSQSVCIVMALTLMLTCLLPVHLSLVCTRTNTQMKTFSGRDGLRKHFGNQNRNVNWPCIYWSTGQHIAASVRRNENTHGQ